MTPTFIGAILIAVAIFLMFRGSATNMLALVLVATLFGGASAVDLPALGGSSIPPANMALLFMAFYLLASRAVTVNNLAQVTRPNLFLAIFCIYGAIGAFLLPRIFAGMIGVVPMNVADAAFLNIYHLVPLGPSSQNITTAVYLLGTLFAGLATALIVNIERSETRVVQVFIALCWAHVFFGVLNLALSTVGHSDWLMFLRNGHYAQVDQELAGGIQRVNGIFPEPSMYAAYGFGILVVMVELWLRDVRARATGAAALGMVAVLMLTTSSTAYVSCGIYALVLGFRFLLTPARVSLRKLAVLGCVLFLVLTAGLAVAVFHPQLGDKLVQVVESMTVHKSQSFSGRQRLFWAQLGILAFKTSYGLGFGPGSFRSSSLFTAIAGSLGVIGIVTFFGQVFALLRPFDKRAHDLSRHDGQEINIAAGWAAVLSLIPAAISAPGPDPGVMFGLLGGLALARRIPAMLPQRRHRLYVHETGVKPAMTQLSQKDVGGKSVPVLYGSRY
ncbi:hypothetical protein FHS83_003162 [Rhizomicrobium palustre]|uniref:Uncharacterized protein n=1 Tax=Rhizomicrobium palustre TaxID=189966 RepID=A0A846N1J8_9PROT|nr:glycoside hydrolase [Rhizomicrobium palustre]NIK89844.1 hypothetical protein [Rhizomicrobium palustre]